MTLNAYQDGTLVARRTTRSLRIHHLEQLGHLPIPSKRPAAHKDDGSTAGVIYTVDETAVPINYEKTLSDDKLTVTNTYKSPTADVTAKKVWVNGPEADHTAVTLNVYQDGTLVAPADYTIVVDPSSGTAGTFTYTISGLLQYKDDGSTAYIYTVDERQCRPTMKKTLSDDKLDCCHHLQEPDG